MHADMFITKLVNDPQYYFFVVITIIVSIVLHELAHGWLAMRHGDRTPLLTGHMTANPLVHLGPFSLVALFLIGMAWGQMPIDPSRMRGRWAEAMVAAAGPATNLLLMLVALTGLGLWGRFGMESWLFGDGGGPAVWQQNLIWLLYIFGSVNLLLFVFNLMPVPPLDGSHILANFSPGYASLLSDPSKQQIWLFGFIGAFLVVRVLMEKLAFAVTEYVNLVAGNTLVWYFIADP